MRTKILHLVGVLVASLIVISSPFNLFPKAQAAESVAQLSFLGSGVQTDSQRFNNFVQIGEETIAFPDADIMEYSPGSVDIDLEKFTDRPLTLTVVAGTRDDGNPVTDSMTLRDIKLVLPSGEALYATGTVANQSYAFRDSGSNRYDFTFEIPVPAQNDVEASLTVPASPLSGMVEILAATNSGNSVTVTAGGQELVGEATGAKFVFEGAGIQTVQNNFNNRIIVGDTEIPMPDRDILKWETAEIAIPANLLSNDLVVTVAAGGTKNHDDFEVRNVRLVLADGTELRDPNYGESDVAELTDGCCPNPEVTAVTQVPFHFELSDAQLAIQRFTWDTTSVVDGDHTIQLSTTDASGQPVFREENVTVVNGNDGEPGDVSVEPALTVPGSPVAGSIDITAISGDGKTMRVTAGGTELSGETAPVQFVFEGSGIQTKSQKFNNRIIVGDEVFPMPDRDVNGWETVEMDIPGELLANEFTVTVAAGGAANHDDFSVRNMHLKMSDGTLLWAKDYPEGTRVELLDGCCPDPNVTAVTEVPFTFDLTDAQLAIQRFKWDTTSVVDGEHSIQLETVTAAGEDITLTETVRVDNTGPVVTINSPEVEQKGNTTFDVSTEDASEVTAVTATLNGDAIALGAALNDSVLIHGENTLVVTATDELGNTTVETFVFNATPEHPTEIALVTPIADEVTGTSTTLSIRATDPTDDPLTVRFYEAESTHAVDAVAAWQGSTDTEPPANLDETVQKELSASDLALVNEKDGQLLETSSTEAYPYQRFDLEVPQLSGDATVEFVWEGHSLPNRLVTIYAYNHVTGAWDALDSARDPEGSAMELIGTLAADNELDGVANIIVQDQLPEPDSYDFTWAWISDTQYYSQDYPEVYDQMAQWIVDTASDRNTTYTLHTGDLVESTGSIPQWENADASMSILDQAGMPYGVIAGNHDNSSGSNHNNYYTYFGEDRFTGMNEFGGSYKNNENSYHLVNEGAAEFLVVYLSYDVDTDELEWAQDVIDEYPERNVVIATHDYLFGNGNRTPEGQVIFDALVEPNDNVFLVLAGHSPGVAHNVVNLTDSDGERRQVIEILSDHQMATTESGDRDTGFLRMLQFDLTTKTLEVSTYSPVLDEYFYEGFGENAENFTLPIDIVDPERLVATDSIELLARSDSPIGEPVEIASGEVASVEWTGLVPGASYSWYAEARDEFGGVLTSSIWSFTVVEDLAGEPAVPPTDEPGDTAKPRDTTKPGDTIAPGDSTSPSDSDAPATAAPADEGNLAQTGATGLGNILLLGVALLLAAGAIQLRARKRTE